MRYEVTLNAIASGVPEDANVRIVEADGFDIRSGDGRHTFYKVNDEGERETVASFLYVTSASPLDE